MKYLISLFLVTSMSSAVAQTAERDRQLSEALTALRSEIFLPGNGELTATAGFGIALFSMAAIGATATLLRLKALPVEAWDIHPGYLMNLAVDNLKYGVAGGGALGFAGTVYAGVLWAKRRGAPVDYHTVEGLKRFFELPLPEQVAMASEDVAFGDFILALDRDFANLNQGFDEHRTR